MSEQGQEVYRTGETWLRLLLMIVYFGLVFYLVKILIGASLVFQSVMVVVRGTVTGLLYTSDAADEGLGVDLGGRRIIKNIISNSTT